MTTKQHVSFDFLRGAGEMGALIQAYNWGSTALGEMETWPKSLLTTLGIILNTKQPMVLWWGDELIQFYNDAYRPTLGTNGKHPQALGQRARESWPETWHVIGPLIDQVKSGIAVYFEDQLIPIFRNGRMEDVYWTFSYSPVFGDTGNIDGVLVVCSETTKKIESLANLKNIIIKAPVPMCIFKGPHHVVEIANERMFELWGKLPDEVVNKPILEWLPEIKEQGLVELLNTVYTTGKTFSAYGRPVNLPRGNRIETIYVNFLYEALLEGDTITGVMAVALDVTEQVVNAKRMAESEQKFRSLVEESAVATAVLEGRDMVLQLVNNAMLEIWGRDRSIIGKPLLEFMPELKDQEFPKILDNVYTTGNFYSAHDSIVKLIRNGVYTEVYMDFSYKPLRNSEDEIYAILVMATDVTQRVLSKKALERSQEELSMAVEIAELGTFYIDVSTYDSLYSKRISEWFGFDRDNLNVDNIISYVVPEDRERVLKSISDSVQNGKPHDVSYKIVNPKTNQERHIRSLGRLRYNEEGKAVALIGTLQDITAQVVARKRIEESERNLRNIILHSPVAMCILLGPTHIIDVANEAMITLWGRQKDTVLDRPVFEALPDASKQGLEQLMDDVYTTGETFRANERPVSLFRNGKYEIVYQNFVYEPYKNVDGKILGVLAISVDVTEQVLARQKIEEIVAERTRELAEANTNLQVSNSQLAQFAYIASHDLQEPARKITTFTEMLLQSYNDPARAKRYIDKIANASQRMLTLIRDVLTFSQVQRDKSLFEKVNLNVIFENTKSDFELLIERKQAVVESDVLPIIDGIPIQLNQLFANLISNALKFIPQERVPHIKVSVAHLSKDDCSTFPQLDADRDYVKLTFTDNGIGFSQEHAEKIFDIFQRLHGKSEFEGTGIGLAICKKIAENHGGLIFAQSTPGYGAQFVLIIPSTQK